jgi:hypothetical protein
LALGLAAVLASGVVPADDPAPPAIRPRLKPNRDPKPKAEPPKPKEEPPASEGAAGTTKPAMKNVEAAAKRPDRSETNAETQGPDDPSIPSPAGKAVSGAAAARGAAKAPARSSDNGAAEEPAMNPPAGTAKGREADAAGKAPPAMPGDDPAGNKPGPPDPNAKGGQAGPAPGAGLNVKLPKPLADRFQQGFELFGQGKFSEAYAILQPLLEKLTPAQRTAIDDVLAARQFRSNAVGLLVACRVRLIELGHAKQLPKPLTIEIAPLARELALDVAATTKPIDDLLKVGFRIDMPPEMLDQHSRSSISAAELIEPAKNLLSSLEEAAKKLKPDELKALPEEERELIAGIAVRRKELDKQRTELLERIVDLNMARMDRGLAAYSNEVTTFDKRFEAGLRVGDAVSRLRQVWPDYKVRKQRTPGSKNPNDLERIWTDGHQRFVRTMPAFNRKLYHFERGKQWWMRGRHGIAVPELGGIWKLNPRGVRNLEQWLIYYPLMMPSKLNKPPDPTREPLSAFMERRHMEWWKAILQMCCNGKLMSRRDYRIATLPPDTQESFLGAVRKEGLPQELISRSWATQLVGWYEYQMAVAHFERLLALCTETEKDAVDRLFGADDATAIHINLSREYDPIDPRSTLTLAQPSGQDPRAASPFEVRGLRWALALAKVELNAMMWIDRRNLSAPAIGFDFWAPTAFEAKAYDELILDGCRQHYYVDRLDLGLNMRPGRAYWSIELRLALTEGFLNSAQERWGRKMTGPQQREFADWRANNAAMINTLAPPGTLAQNPWGGPVNPNAPPPQPIQPGRAPRLPGPGAGPLRNNP